MATVIDSLIVELGLDPKKFTQGQKDALTEYKKTQEEMARRSREIESDTNKTSAAFSRLRNHIIGVGAALLGAAGIKEFVSNVVHTDVEVGRFSKTMNVAVDVLSAWRNVATVTGGTAAGITSTLSNLTNQLQTFTLTGESSAIPYFRALGISIVDSNGKLKSATDLLYEMADAKQRLHLDNATFTTLARAIGIDDATIALMLRGSTEMRKLYEEQKKIGTISKEDTEAANELSKSWNDAANAAQGMGRSVLTYLTPALTTLLDRWTQIFTELKKGEIIAPYSLLGRLLGRDSAGRGNVLFNPGLRGSKSANPNTEQFGPPTQSQDDINKFVAMGWSREQAAGIVAGAIIGESNGNHQAVGDGGQAYGLAQWHPDRQRAFAQWAGKDIRQSTRDEQLNFIDFELRQGKEQKAGRALMAAQTAEESARVVTIMSERPADPAGQANIRAGIASRLNRPNVLSGAGAAVANSTDNSQSSTSTSTSETHIGKVEIHTQAKDADSIAKEITPALKRSSDAAQSNYGQY